MGLLLWQNNLVSVSTSGFGSAGAVPAKKQSVPQRNTMEFVTGRGFFMPEVTTSATEPFFGEVGSTPPYPYVFAVDDESTELSVATLAAGTSTTLTTTVGFTLPGLALDPTDSASLLLIPDIWLDPVVSGLVLASVQLTPQALTPTNGWIDAHTLQGGQTYTNWRCQVTLGLVAVTLTVATKVHVGAKALLTIEPQ